MLHGLLELFYNMGGCCGFGIMQYYDAHLILIPDANNVQCEMPLAQVPVTHGTQRFTVCVHGRWGMESEEGGKKKKGEKQAEQTLLGGT